MGQNFKQQVRVIGESTAKLLWPETPSIKRALSAEVRRHFCGPNFALSLHSPKDAFLMDMSETRQFN